MKKFDEKFIHAHSKIVASTLACVENHPQLEILFFQGTNNKGATAFDFFYQINDSVVRASEANEALCDSVLEISDEQIHETHSVGKSEWEEILSLCEVYGENENVMAQWFHEIKTGVKNMSKNK